MEATNAELGRLGERFASGNDDTRKFWSFAPLGGVGLQYSTIVTLTV